MNWYALYTAARFEKKLYNLLIQQDIEAYLPLVKTLKQWSDRKKWIEEPLFKSYIFVRINYPSKEYHDIITSKGAVKLVHFRNGPIIVPDNEINNIKLIIEKGYSVQATSIPLKKGNPVEIISGPLMGLKGEIINTRGKKNFIVKVLSVNAAITVNIEGEDLKLLPQKNK